MQFYYYKNGERKGPITSAQLKFLASSGIIDEETDVATDDGKNLKAGRIKGLAFKEEEKTSETSEISEFAKEPDVPVVVPVPQYNSVEASSHSNLSTSAALNGKRKMSQKWRKITQGSNFLLLLSIMFFVLGWIAYKSSANQSETIKPLLARHYEADYEYDDLGKKEEHNQLHIKADDFGADYEWERDYTIEGYEYDEAHKYVSGDAFNFIIDGTYFTGYSVRELRSLIFKVISWNVASLVSALFFATSGLLFGLWQVARILERTFERICLKPGNAV